MRRKDWQILKFTGLIRSGLPIPPPSSDENVAECEEVGEDRQREGDDDIAKLEM